MQRGTATVVSFPSTGGVDVSVRTLDPAVLTTLENDRIPPPQPWGKPLGCEGRKQFYHYRCAGDVKDTQAARFARVQGC